MRTYLLAIVFAVAVGDGIYSLFLGHHPYITNFLRPVVIVIFANQIRTNLQAVALDFKDSCTVITTIFAFISFFAFAGFFLFQGKFEGVLNFDTLGDSYYNMHILLTTANFPDVMLPAYNSSRANSLFFLTFLTFGLYFLLNVLLAVIFENYKSRIEERVIRHRERRFEYIEKYYDKFDTQK